MVNHDAIDVDVRSTHATLRLSAAMPQHSGNFTCSPEHMRSASVSVHVLEADGYNSAAAIEDIDHEDPRSEAAKPLPSAWVVVALLLTL